MGQARSVWLLVTTLLLAACGVDRGFLDVPWSDLTPPDNPRPPDAPLDGGLDASREAGPDATGMDAPRDAVAVDAQDVAADRPSGDAADVPSLDAGPADGGPSGRCTPSIDGVVGTDWPAAALVVRNDVATAWANNELHVLRVCYDPSNLYLGIEGTVEAMNAIVVYLDRDLGAGTGVADLATLTDDSGALDNRVSAALALGVAGLGVDAAWGTAGLQSLAAGATSDLAGLRLLASLPGGPDRRADFAWATGAASVCNPTPPAACEVSIAWSAIYEGARPPSGAVGLFARINNDDGSLSANQTLPQDDATAPRSVGRVLRVPFSP